jgi:hypothetical protein
MEKRMSMNRPRGHISSYLYLALAATALTLGACSLLKPKPAVEMSTADVNLNSSWHASIASPPDLAGVVQMNGSASMAPGTKRGTTQVVLNLGNTSPGGVHPWAIHLGQCNSDQGVFGDAQNYPPLRVSSDGTGLSSATVAINTPISGSYFVSVQASPANSGLTVACGNLAAPTT